MKNSKVKFSKTFPSTMKVDKIYVDLNSWKVEVPVNLLTKDKDDFSDVIIIACENIIYDEKVIFKINEKIPFFPKTVGGDVNDWQNWNAICFDFHKTGVEDFDKSLLKNKTIGLQFTAEVENF
jgi:hypothetical protein